MKTVARVLVPALMLAIGFWWGRASVDRDLPRAERRADTAERPARELTKPEPAKPAPRARPEPASSTERSSPRGREEPEAEPEMEAESATPFPDGAIYGTDAWSEERFPRWYRENAARYGLRAYPVEMLRSFSASVIRQLGRVPRREVLDRLLAAHAEFHAVLRATEAAQGKGEMNQFEVDDRRATARRDYSDRLYRDLEYADYRFLTREWNDDKNPFHAFRHDRPSGVARSGAFDPYAIRAQSDEVTFVGWYQSYGSDYQFPQHDSEYLGDFFRAFVEPLDRLPEPTLMRALLKIERRERDAADLADDLRRVLDPRDLDRLRTSDRWRGELD
ncbi:MAG: hypothetical protein AAGD14_09440 [Planctomycetota bacterium]